MRLGLALVILLGACSAESTETDMAVENTLVLCQDQEDNDGDGLVDCLDPDCQVFVACAPGQDAGDRADGEGGADSAVVDAGADDSATQDQSPTDQGGQDSGGCCYGSLKGLVCAPNKQVYVAAATVTVETVDCTGEPVTYKTISQMDGTYYFETLPCGMQPVHIQKGNFETEYEVIVKKDHLTDISGADMKKCFGAGGASIAVFWGQWDEMHDIVDRLGFDYEWYYYEDTLYADEPDWESTTAIQLLQDPDALLDYNVIILNCGSAYMKWVKEFPEIEDNLRDWVLLGGSLYMSDLAWIMGERMFPDAIDFWSDDDEDGAQVIEGNQDFDAFLVDASLAEYVGEPELKVHYGPGPLISVDGAGEGTVVHATAHVKQCMSFWDSCIGDVKIDEVQPVILSYEPGPFSGRVVFSGFHVDEQEEQDTYDKILYYMLFTL